MTIKKSDKIDWKSPGGRKDQNSKNAMVKNDFDFSLNQKKYIALYSTNMKK